MISIIFLSALEKNKLMHYTKRDTHESNSIKNIILLLLNLEIIIFYYITCLSSLYINTNLSKGFTYHIGLSYIKVINV